MTIYFPLLRWKQGERGALEKLIPAIKDQVNPIIEFPINCDYEDKKVTSFCKGAVDDWGVNRPFYLDLTAIDYDDAPIGNSHPALTLLRTAHQQQLIVIPVLNLDMDLDLLNAIQQAYSEGCYRNLAFRITEDEEDSANNDISQLINQFGIKNTNIDLIVDLRDISNGLVRPRIRILNSLIDQFGTDFRRTIVLSGAIPNDLGNYVGTDTNECIPRYDWKLWLQSHQIDNLKHLLFGDYVTISCEFREVKFQGAPKIKYTLDDEWFIIKGHRARQKDNQRQEQARDLIRSGFFRGKNNSFGELRIDQCANGIWGPGSAANWVTNDVNQHITFVTSQVSAILGAP
jgi:hypothetical protein